MSRISPFPQWVLTTIIIIEAALAAFLMLEDQTEVMKGFYPGKLYFVMFIDALFVAIVAGVGWLLFSGKYDVDERQVFKSFGNTVLIVCVFSMPWALSLYENHPYKVIWMDKWIIEDARLFLYTVVALIPFVFILLTWPKFATIGSDISPNDLI